MIKETKDRITSGMSNVDVVLALAENLPGAIEVVGRCIKSDPLGFLAVLPLDSKRLYGKRIWELYLLCGEDIERFKYHYRVELPNQETGELRVNGAIEYELTIDDKFWAKRRFGKPGSFWALENPPFERKYEYPIK